MDELIFVTLTVTYNYDGIDWTDVLSFHDLTPYFPRTQQVLSSYDENMIVGMETVHSTPPHPLPPRTHAGYCGYVH